MAMRNYMQDLMRDQKVSEVYIVHDASVASLPDEDPLIGSCSNSCVGDDSQMQSSQLNDNIIGKEFSGPFCVQNENMGSTASLGSLLGFRERQRRLKEILSPVKVHKMPLTNQSVISQSTPTQPLSSTSENSSHGRADSLRSRLTRLASDSNVISGPPRLNDVV